MRRELIAIIVTAALLIGAAASQSSWYPRKGADEPAPEPRPEPEPVKRSRKKKEAPDEARKVQSTDVD